MKKITLFAIVGMMLLAMTGCKKDNDKNNEKNPLYDSPLNVEYYVELSAGMSNFVSIVYEVTDFDGKVVRDTVNPHFDGQGAKLSKTISTTENKSCKVRFWALPNPNITDEMRQIKEAYTYVVGATTSREGLKSDVYEERCIETHELQIRDGYYMWDILHNNVVNRMFGDNFAYVVTRTNDGYTAKTEEIQ